MLQPIYYPTSLPKVTGDSEDPRVGRGATQIAFICLSNTTAELRYYHLQPALSRYQGRINPALVMKCSSDRINALVSQHDVLFISCDCSGFDRAVVCHSRTSGTVSKCVFPAICSSGSAYFVDTNNLRCASSFN